MSNEMEIIFEKGIMLRDHMENNFYPPIRQEVISSWIIMFAKYWKGEITYDRFVELCPVEEEELVHRFRTFFYEDDLQWED